MNHDKESIIHFGGNFLDGWMQWPLLKEDAEPFTRVTFKNLSSGYVQNFYFKDNAGCTEPNLIGYTMQPGETRIHSIPADKIITIATSAWSLPGDPGKVAWCNPIFLSTKLKSGQSYEAIFMFDVEKKRCGTNVLPLDDKTGKELKIVRRKGSGPWGAGVMAGTFSCERAPELEILEK